MSGGEKDASTDLWKWLLGIAGSVVAGLLLLVLGPIVTGGDKTPTPVPTLAARTQIDIKILDLPNITLASASEDTLIPVEVYNEGNTAAERCQIQVNDENSSRLTNSNFFGLVAGASETIDLSLRPFDKSLEFQAVTVKAQVICQNGLSPNYSVVLSILP